jgi:hypothetical protein
LRTFPLNRAMIYDILLEHAWISEFSCDMLVER